MPGNHILLVDDSSILRSMLRAALEGLGFAVTEAANGRVALDLARRYFPDLILADLEMPVLDGWQFARGIRQDFRTADMPAVLMTAREDVSPADALRGGFYALLRKPFTLADLHRAITSVLQRPAA